MNTETDSDDECVPPSSPEDPIYTSFGGGMFAGSQYFSIGGGTFNNNNTTNHYHPPPPPPAKVPNFQIIPMGDIDLQRELTMNETSGNIDRRRERHCVRRVYSAKIDGRNTDLTVAVYEGGGAEEDWRRDVKMYMSLRHPNIIQMYGTARSGAMYATIFHGDLIPYGQFLAAASPIVRVYAYLCYVTEWRLARDYVERSPYQIGLEMHSTLSIRRSNGRLCVDFGPQPNGKNEGSNFFRDSIPWEYHPAVNPSSDPTSQEAAAIHCLKLEEYHDISAFTLRRHRSGHVSSFATISFGAVIVLPQNGQLEEGAEIAYLPRTEFLSWGWHLGKERLSRKLMENDWNRFDAKDVCDDALTYSVDFYGHSYVWLRQANYIFSRLQITSHLEDYVVVNTVRFQITIGNTREDTPPGYLFLCPTTNFQTGPSSFSWPDCPAYWSLDPSGVDRLTTEEATQLGLPSFQLTTTTEGFSWDTSVYAGLRQFHRAKGFDPDSQDVARHIGYDLYQLSRGVNSPFAHMEEDGEDEEDGLDNGTDGGETDDDWEDAQSSVEVEQDGDKSTENSNAKEDEGPLNVCTEPREQNTAEARQEPAHSVDQDPNPAEHRVLSAGVTGSGFIHHIIGGLQRGLARGLVIETENVNAEPISPFLI